MEKCFFIHPQMWDERMETHIYIYIYIYREREREKEEKTHPNLVFMDWKSCSFPNAQMEK
jgi:hypothetical protein